MLKIKEGIDLKELEKFGFKSFILNCWGHTYHNTKVYLRTDEKYGYYINVYEKDRTMKISKDEVNYPDAPYEFIIDLFLFNLIPLEFIEKVSDESWKS